MKLTDTQLVILSSAAGREDRTALPIPASVKLKGATLDKALDGLCKKDLLAERPADLGAETWRGTGIGERTTLVITDAGLEAIGVQSQGPADVPPDQPRPAGRRSRTAGRSKPKSKRVKPTEHASKPSPRAGTKLDKVIAMLRRKSGASVSDIAATTGWQPHTVRAALSGLRKRGLGLIREKGRDGSVHRIART